MQGQLHQCQEGGKIQEKSVLIFGVDYHMPITEKNI